MALPTLSQLTVYTGTAMTNQVFGQAGTYGPPRDWATQKDIPSPEGFRLPGGQDGLANCCVIVTPTATAVTDHIAAPVGIVQDLTSTNTGANFQLSARNSDCYNGNGHASFNWIAISNYDFYQNQLGNLIHPPRPSVRMRVFQRQSYDADCVSSGDTLDSGFDYWSPLQAGELDGYFAFLTACDSGVQGHNAAVVGVARPNIPLLQFNGQAPNQQGLSLHTRNSDSESGECAFYVFAITPDVPDATPEGNPITPDGANLVVDMGTIDATANKYYIDNGVQTPDLQQFASAGQWGDTLNYNVDFHAPFLVPPVVLLTANNVGVGGNYNAAVVGIAQNVTPNGFILSGRSSDTQEGWCGFYWVAIGYEDTPAAAPGMSSG
jgi:hypothetical protein